MSRGLAISIKPPHKLKVGGGRGGARRSKPQPHQRFIARRATLRYDISSEVFRDSWQPRRSIRAGESHGAFSSLDLAESRFMRLDTLPLGLMEDEA
jgi:hypothetical protein